MFLCLELLLGDLGYCGGASEVSGRDVTVETRHSHAALQNMQAASCRWATGLSVRAYVVQQVQVRPSLIRIITGFEGRGRWWIAQETDRQSQTLAIPSGGSGVQGHGDSKSFLWMCSFDPGSLPMSGPGAKIAKMEKGKKSRGGERDRGQRDRRQRKVKFDGRLRAKGATALIQSSSGHICLAWMILRR